MTLDGEKLAPALVGTPLERDPGRHVVRVAGERVAQPLERAVDLASGDTKRSRCASSWTMASRRA